VQHFSPKMEIIWVSGHIFILTPSYLPRVSGGHPLTSFYLGTAFREIKGKLFPSVGMKKSGEHIRVNFGQSPFVYDIDGMMSVSNNSHSNSPGSTFRSMPLSMPPNAELPPPDQPLERLVFWASKMLPYVPRSRLEWLVRDYFSERAAQEIYEFIPERDGMDFTNGILQREKAHIRNDIASTRFVSLL
jgi:hypothetical protein